MDRDLPTGGLPDEPTAGVDPDRGPGALLQAELSRRAALGGLVAWGGLLFLPMAGCGPAPVPPGRTPSSAPASSPPPTPTTEELLSMKPPADYQLPPLPYAVDALEPIMDAQTVKLHHDMHHAGYVKGANEARSQLAAARSAGDFKLVDHWSKKLAFHASGHLLHSLFWLNMAPPAKGGAASKELGAALDAAFGGLDPMKGQLSAAAKSVEGSGWGILGWQPFDQALVVLQCQNHEKLAIWGVVPLLVVDVWEHAYYLKYQNRRAEFVDAWWGLVNWSDVSDRFAKAARTKL